MATLLLETERTSATLISGYFENVVPNSSHSKLKKIANEKKYVSVADGLCGIVYA